MVSALRQRAEAAAGSGDGDERVEPTLMPEGTQPPVVTDEVVVPGVSVWRRAVHLVLRVLQTLGALARRVPLQSVALVALGAGLALFSLGLASYLWSSPQAAGHAPGVAMAGASAPEASNHAEGVQRTAETGPSVAHAPAHETKAAPDVEGKHMAQEGVKAAATEEAKEEVKEATQAQATAIADEAKEDTKPESMLDPTYGTDGNANGVPDALERWLTRTLHSVPTQESARQYYRTVLPLASKLHLGIALSRSEKLMALRAAECYLLTANDEGLRTPPNLNDKVLMLGDDSATRMKALFVALQGVDFPLSVSRQQACG